MKGFIFAVGLLFSLVPSTHAVDDSKQDEVAVDSNTWATGFPIHVFTPGRINPVLTKEVICSPKFRTENYRKVSLQTKKDVFSEYKVKWEDRDKYEVDHLISIELGGSNNIENLWPEPYMPKPGAREKDMVENYLRKQVCEGVMPLKQAQDFIAHDWYEIYKEIEGVE
jgi:hypothetical protein